MLRLACASKGGLADALSQITTELCNLGVCSVSLGDKEIKSILVLPAFQCYALLNLNDFVQVLSEWARDLASKPSSVFNKTFDHIFHQHAVCHMNIFFFFFFLIARV